MEKTRMKILTTFAETLKNWNSSVKALPLVAAKKTIVTKNEEYNEEEPHHNEENELAENQKKDRQPES